MCDIFYGGNRAAVAKFVHNTGVQCHVAIPVGMIAAGASAVSYSLGILAHWLLSSRTVFHDTVAPGGIERTKQKALFVGSALLGLAVTTAIVGSGDFAGLDPRLAKLVAIAASFVLTWMLRSKLVFRARAA